jgi:hypothetical protein
MGLKKKNAVFLVVLFYPFVSSFAETAIYGCLDSFHKNFSNQYKQSSYRSHIKDHEISKRRVGKQNVIVANLIDPVDDKKKKLFLTKTKAKVCDPSAEAGERCKVPEERHLNASVGKHISVLPDVYKDTLRQIQSKGEDAEIDTTKSYRPGDVLNRLSDCSRVSKTLRRRITNKSRALTTIYNGVIGGGYSEGVESIEASSLESNSKATK